MKPLATIMEGLRAPFPSDALEFRIAQSGEKSGKVWATILAWYDARTLAERFDDVCGAYCQVSYREMNGIIICAISIWDDETKQWITREDGAGEMGDAHGGLSSSDQGKGSLTLAFRRAAQTWGVGRDLWLLADGAAFAETTTTRPRGNEWKRAKVKEGPEFWWKPSQETLQRFGVPVVSSGEAQKKKEVPIRTKLSKLKEKLVKQDEVLFSGVIKTVDHLLTNKQLTEEELTQEYDAAAQASREIWAKRTI